MISAPVALCLVVVVIVLTAALIGHTERLLERDCDRVLVVMPIGRLSTGLQIRDLVNERFGARLHGAPYAVLHHLEDDGLVLSLPHPDSNGPRLYRLTEAGVQAALHRSSP